MARVQIILISVISIIYILHCLHMTCNYILFEMFIFLIVHLNTLLVLALKINSIEVLFYTTVVCLSVLHVQCSTCIYPFWPDTQESVLNREASYYAVVPPDHVTHLMLTKTLEIYSFMKSIHV